MPEIIVLRRLRQWDGKFQASMDSVDRLGGLILSDF
jgi:hypothetical protein